MERLAHENGSVNEADRNVILNRVLNSATFRRTKRLRRLLEVAVGADTANTKPSEYRIAIEAFDRSEDFDPRINPMVRVQFGRLRRRLAEYYQAEGRNDPMRIALPERGYRPRFEPNQAPSGATKRNGAAAAVPADEPPGLSLAVLPFANLTGDPEQGVFCQGLAEELISAFSSVEDVDVASRNSTVQFEGQVLDVREVGKDLQVAMVLEGSVRRENDQTRVTVQLTAVKDGFVLWSESFDRKVEAVIPMQEELAGAIVEKLQPKLQELEVAV